MAGLSLYDKLWNAHVVATAETGENLLYVDRHLVHEVSTPQSFAMLDQTGRTVRVPEAQLAVADHAVPTRRAGHAFPDGPALKQVERLKRNVSHYGITYLPLDGPHHGIVHVAGPELGFTLPGALLVCGDSHTSTHGAFGALSFGIGASECGTVLATQTIWQKKQKTMRIRITGTLSRGVTVKDVVLGLIAEIGTGGGVGYALEFAGPVVEALSMEQRMTLCNMAIEAGSRVGLVAPDETTIAYLKGRPLAPEGALWEVAVEAWRALPSDPDAVFDREITFDVTNLGPQVSWGTTPEQTISIGAMVPEPAAFEDPVRRNKAAEAQRYMGLEGGRPIAGTQIDRVFIGSCTNSRIEDLRAAAAVLDGRKVAPNVVAIAVPGSMQVRRQAEHEGLDAIFRAAGFEWRESGCSMCVGMNDDRLEAGERCASTSNRNFEGRQGKGGRTHLVSPQMAAAAAIAGCLTDVREYL
ncbi:3-isopropylmalate dehydratase large subunit [Martelella limonii]|uniref:3-isopropylmalate dehydratase large subunit n=1 Tax=Martelella limonii TaxID=1647649 RepID=UPI001580E06E|nr:3-isopropylmalate dehydratase large subunit [Martelella limonii]